MERLKKNTVWDTPHRTPKKADKQSVWRVEFIFFSVMLPILANYYTSLDFFVTFLIKQKSKRTWLGGKQQQKNNKKLKKLHAA